MLQTSVNNGDCCGGNYDDVAVPCRVRQSTSEALEDFNEEEDMLCTMRIWHNNKPTTTRTKQQQQQPRSASTSRHGGRLPPPTSAPGLMSTSIVDVTPSNDGGTTTAFRKSHSFGGTYVSNSNNNGGGGGGGPLHQRLGIQTTTKREAELILTSLQNPLMVNNCYSGELDESIQLSERFESFGSNDSRKKQQLRHKQRKNRHAGAKIWDACATPDASMNGGGNSSTRSSGLRVRASLANNQQGGGGGGGRRQSSYSLPLGNITIPISDIMKVDMYGEGDCHKTNITTMSFGFLEFSLENRNGQEVLLAFLKASLPKDRIIDSAIPRAKSNDSAEEDDYFYDVEKFTAKRITERIESESFGEKVRRKVGRVILSIEEVMSDSLESCGCGSGNNSLSPPDPAFEKRDSPPRGNSLKNSSQHSTSSNRSRRSHSSSGSRKQTTPYGVELASPTPPRAYSRATMKKIGTVNSAAMSVGASGDLSMKQQASQRSVGTYLSVEGEDSELEPTR